MKPKTASEKGQVLIIMALAAIGIFAMVGLAIDGSRKFSDRRHAQNAADTAAIAASLAKINAMADPTKSNDPAICPPPDDAPSDVCAELLSAGFQRATDNGYDGNLVTNAVEIYSPPISGPYAGNGQYVQVIINSYINTTFTRVLGIFQLQNKVEAVAKSRSEYKGELYGGASIVGLAPDKCKTIWFSGSALTDITGGGVFSNSNVDCGVTIQGSTNIYMDSSIDMVADAYVKNGNPPLGGIAGGFNSGADPYEYPPPDEMLPKITCSGNAKKNGNSMSPGNWSGTFPPSGVKTLNPGIYCIKGDFKLNSKDNLTGSGVTIYMQSGGITWNGGANVNLSAPTSGDLAGMLIFAPMSNTSTMNFNGNATSLLTGTVLMPAAPIIYNGTGNLNPSYVQIIGYTVELTGSNTTNILYQDGDNWDATIPAQVGLMN